MSSTYNVKSIIKAAFIFAAVLLSTKAIADGFSSSDTSVNPNVTASSVWQQMGQWMHHGFNHEHQCSGMMGKAFYRNNN
ncbi:MAG: hypothetical protein CENE_00617 [Candidatus Celerinatantimonas neptuna]|nr:MAG: hypothetical protein CENE_00617 [Candidatus Celerinatantimonas neptuna]